MLFKSSFHTPFIRYPRLCPGDAWELPCLSPGFDPKTEQF